MKKRTAFAVSVLAAMTLLSPQRTDAQRTTPTEPVRTRPGELKALDALRLADFTCAISVSKNWNDGPIPTGFNFSFETNPKWDHIQIIPKGGTVVIPEKPAKFNGFVFVRNMATNVGNIDGVLSWWAMTIVRNGDVIYREINSGQKSLTIGKGPLSSAVAQEWRFDDANARVNGFLNEDKRIVDKYVVNASLYTPSGELSKSNNECSTVFYIEDHRCTPTGCT